MAQYELARFGYEPLRFQGEVVVRRASEPVVAPLGERFVELAVYRCDEGGYVAHLVYRSSVVGENEVSIAEQLDQVTDVQDFFFAFEPSELAKSAGVDEEVGSDLAAQLYARYESAAREILASMPVRKDSTTDGAVGEKPSPNPAETPRSH
jgi:hypothetical protein